jgi:hypothetical protein
LKSFTSTNLPQNPSTERTPAPPCGVLTNPKRSEAKAPLTTPLCLLTSDSKPQLDSRAIQTDSTRPHFTATYPLNNNTLSDNDSARPRQPRPKCSASTPAPNSPHNLPAPTHRSSRKPNNNSKAKAKRNNSCLLVLRAQARTRTRRASRRYTESRRISWRLRYVLPLAGFGVREGAREQKLLGAHVNILRRRRRKNSMRTRPAQYTKVPPQEHLTYTHLLPNPGNRPPNPPTHSLALVPLHNLPDPPVDQHPGLQTAPLRSATAVFRFRSLPRPLGARERPGFNPNPARKSVPEPVR